MQDPVNNQRPANKNGRQTTGDALPLVLQTTSMPPTRARSLLHSFVYALQGILYAVRTQRNFRIHCVITSLVVIAGLALRITVGQWEALTVVIGLVFQTELTNTAVEALVDRVSPEFHELAKAAKDCSAAAVLVTAISATVVGLLIFGPHVVALLLQVGL